MKTDRSGPALAPAAIQLLRLCAADLRRDGLLTTCSVLSLAAALAPLLVLFGLQQGVIGTLIERQNSDPAMRLIRPEVSGATRYDSAWFERVRQWPDVAFVVPGTRLIAGQVELFATNAPQPVRATLLATGAGDPLLPDGGPLPTRLDEIVVSAEISRRLALAPGSTIRLAFSRILEGREQPRAIEVKVIGISPAGRLADSSVLVSLDLVQGIEWYRDGHAVPALGLTGKGPPPTVTEYPLFRLFATSIQAVPALVERLRAGGSEVTGRVAEIRATLDLQRNLQAVLIVISLLAAIGYLVSLAAFQVATVRRKRQEFAILTLVGYGRRWLMSLPCLESLVTSMLGALLGVALFAVTAAIINRYFSAQLAIGEAACTLGAGELAGAVAVTLLVAAVPALAAGLMAARTETADELRDI